jgi:hypothetical protein
MCQYIFHGFSQRIILFYTIYFVNFEFAMTTSQSIYLFYFHSIRVKELHSKVHCKKNHLTVSTKKLMSHNNE